MFAFFMRQNYTSRKKRAENEQIDATKKRKL